MKYELRERKDRDTQGAKVITVSGSSDDFALACQVAEKLGGTWDIWQEDENAWHDSDHLSYIVTYCGASPYWHPLGQNMHQVGSAGFCWTCLNEGAGLIRHPVTPDEVRKGLPPARCFVCEAWQNAAGRIRHDPQADHTVAWGEEAHPRCIYCGKGYQIATPEGTGYLEHDDGCKGLTADGAAEVLDVREVTCPRCGATRDRWCKNYSGDQVFQLTQVHPERLAAWRKSQLTSRSG